MALRKPVPFSATHLRDLDRIHRYIDVFDKAAADRESKDPDWRSRSLLWVIESSLKELERALRRETRVHWNSPFWAFQYPVNWDWDKWQWNQSELAIQYGQLTSQNTRTRKLAVRALAQMSVRQQIYQTLQYLTHEVSTYKVGRYQHPMVPEPLAETVRSIRGRKSQFKMLEELFFPFSIGATEVEVPANLKSGQKIPPRIAKQLMRATRAISIKELVCPMTLDGHRVSVRIIFQVFPLTIDGPLKRAYFPITVGVTLTPDEPPPQGQPRLPKWLDPEQWSQAERRKFWDCLGQWLRHARESLRHIPRDEVAKTVEEVTTKIEIEMKSTSPEEVRNSADKILSTLRQKGFVTNYQINANTAPSSADVAARAGALLENVKRAKDAATKGKALEELLAMLLAVVPGFDVAKRVRTTTEEIDLKVLNSHPDPRWRDTPMILFECKNWSKVCGKDEVVLFERKLENRRNRARLGFLVSWEGFAKTAPQELLRGSRGKIQVALLTGEDLRAAAKAGDVLPALRAAVDRADST